MATTSSPVTVFVSSTIDDLRDLRSALKVWLEELGLDVRMSEFNDFGREPERGTFESCFDAIDGCDFFVLLLGGRKGAPYPSASSVTREEFRRAVALARQGRIKIVAFVRDEVMTALYERRALKRMLDSDQILALGDAEAVAAFLDTSPSR